MATEIAYSKFLELFSIYTSIEQNKVIRGNVGDESLSGKIEPKLSEMQDKLDFAIKYGLKVPDSYLTSFNSQLDQINTYLLNLANFNNTEFIANKNQYLINIESHLEAIRSIWCFFITAAIEAEKFLDDKGIEKRYQEFSDNVKSESEKTLIAIKQEAASVIEEAKKLAEEIKQNADIVAKQIENNARNVAKGVSVEVAQNQFKDAQFPLFLQIGFWALISIVTLGFIAYLINHFLSETLPKDWSWQIAYHSTIRFAALATLGSLAAYFMKILKAHLHMYQHNKHRCTLANSMSSFVDSASTPEQRDLILGHLVSSIADFGNTGLVSDKESDGSKLSIGNIVPTINPAK